MILVIGGQASGKRTWVEEHLGYRPDDLSSDLSSTTPVLYDLQDHADKVIDPASLLERAVVICDEVGCGIVPADPVERAQREVTGRLCCALAAQATCVVRVVCGIGTIIKGELAS